MSKNYFTIAELCRSTYADMHGIDNTPATEGINDALHLLITECLNPIREGCGFPITVTSGYRCATLNACVGGKADSQHLRGEAVDLVGKNTEQTRKIFEVARELGNFDQLLFETNGKGDKWVHLSYKKNGNRGQAIDNYKAYHVNRIMNDEDDEENRGTF